MFINPRFFTECSLIGYTEAALNDLMNRNSYIVTSIEYHLFYCIKESFKADFNSLWNVNIDGISLAFPYIQRNTRYMIEAILDLFNLYRNPAYSSVLRYQNSHNIHDWNESFNRYFPKRNINIAKKYNLAIDNGLDDSLNLMPIVHNANNYVHPNVFVEILQMEDRQKKCSILYKLLNVNFKIYMLAYEIILKKFNGGKQILVYPKVFFPVMNNDYFSYEKDKFEYLLNSPEFIVLESNCQVPIRY